MVYLFHMTSGKWLDCGRFGILNLNLCGNIRISKTKGGECYLYIDKENVTKIDPASDSDPERSLRDFLSSDKTYFRIHPFGE